MMPPGAFNQFRHLLNLPENTGADTGMRLDYLILFRSQFTGFVDYGIRNPDLSYVMQQPHHVDVFLLFGSIAVPPGDFAGILCDACGMAVRVLVLGVNRLCERLHHMHGQPFVFPGLARHSIRQVSLKVNQFKRMLNTQCQHVGCERLRDEINCAEFKAFCFSLQAVVGGQENYGQCHIRIGPFHLSESFQAVNPWHPDIQQDQIRFLFFQEFQKFLSGRKCGHFQFLFLQHVFSQNLIGAVVVYDNNPFLVSAPLILPGSR